MKFTKRQAPGSSGGTDKYLKIKDGESKSLWLTGEIYEFYMKWVNGKSVNVEPTDPEGKSRFRVNAGMIEDGKPVMKIWEFPLTVYRQLSAINEEYPLETIKIKVSRHGSGTDTEYHVLPLLRDKIEPSLKLMDLHILNNKPAQAKPMASPPNGWDNEPMPEEHDEIPF